MDLRRETFDTFDEPLFIFRDRRPVKAEQVCKVLRQALSNINLEPSLYDTHSWRIGRASDLMKWGYSLPQIKIWGRWRSNVVYKYIRECQL